MSLSTAEQPAIPAALIDEVKAFLRLDHSADDAAIGAFLSSALELCENFTGQIILARSFADTINASGDWQKLSRLPVRTIATPEYTAANGSAVPMGAAQYVADIDSNGRGWLRLHGIVTARRVRVPYQAGMAADWGDVPASLRQGIIRLAGYFYANRDNVDASGPPSAVTALWQPHRRMRIA